MILKGIAVRRNDNAGADRRRHPAMFNVRVESPAPPVDRIEEGLLRLLLPRTNFEIVALDVYTKEDDLKRAAAKLASCDDTEIMSIYVGLFHYSTDGKSWTAKYEIDGVVAATVSDTL